MAAIDGQEIPERIDEKQKEETESDPDFQNESLRSGSNHSEIVRRIICDL